MELILETLGLTESAQLLSLSAPGWGANLLRGLANSLKIAFGAFGFGLLIGLFGAYGKLYGGPVLRDLLAIYTTVIRAVPELVLILILYYVGTDLINQLSAALGYGRVEISGIVAGIWVLGIVQGAYSIEVLRGAIQAVPPGQIEAARAFGMPPMMTMWRVTIPAMMSFATPGLANLWLIATKDTALLAIVGFSELTLETRQAASSTRAYFTFFLAAGGLYLMVTLCSGVVFGWIEKWARRGQPSLREGRG
ncbi:ABC transporter permease [Parasedimentitalea marina]|uniref:ABC transporter permease n=1 Tax=Parasedimentitalea marina TaxID=2483033 RepID=A0A3T0N2Z3_9RHOB|nr:ABC transporter permease [Parasedimentitalea marina]AZV78406.1 ABC transporter permease [Parasedimentitalea marina]